MRVLSKCMRLLYCWYYWCHYSWHYEMLILWWVFLTEASFKNNKHMLFPQYKKKNIPTYFINHYIITFHSPPISFGTRLLTFLAWCSHFNENNSGGARLFTIHNIDNYPIKFLLQAFPYIWWRDLQYPYFGSNRESEPWVRLL